MSLKALMVDVDGVIVRPRGGRRWDCTLEADLGIRPQDLQQAFFTPHWQAIATGKAAIEDHLPGALAMIAPDVSAETLLAYWFQRDAELDHVLLEDLARVRASGLQLHLATVQEHRRADYLWTTLGLRDRFDGLHHSAAVGFAKPDPAYFAAVQTRSGFAADELLLIDDSPHNIEGAKRAGWRGALWTSELRLEDLLGQISP